MSSPLLTPLQADLDSLPATLRSILEEAYSYFQRVKIEHRLEPSGVIDDFANTAWNACSFVLLKHYPEEDIDGGKSAGRLITQMIRTYGGKLFADGSPVDSITFQPSSWNGVVREVARDRLLTILVHDMRLESLMAEREELADRIESMEPYGETQPQVGDDVGVIL